MYVYFWLKKEQAEKKRYAAENNIYCTGFPYWMGRC
jgi:hypothetical protein